MYYLNPVEEFRLYKRTRELHCPLQSADLAILHSTRTHHSPFQAENCVSSTGKSVSQLHSWKAGAGSELRYIRELVGLTVQMLVDEYKEPTKRS